MALNLRGSASRSDEIKFIYSDKTPVLGEISPSIRVLVGRWSETAAEKIEIRRIRKDANGNEIVGKGIGLTEDEAKKLVEILQKSFS